MPKKPVPFSPLVPVPLFVIWSSPLIRSSILEPFSAQFDVCFQGPLEHADRLRAPMLLFFGGNDPFIPPEQVEKIKDRLAELKKEAETVVYPDAPHGFFCDERDSYRADAARDAWEKMTRFFEKHLKQ